MNHEPSFTSPLLVSVHYGARDGPWLVAAPVMKLAARMHVIYV
jgi:hypothetical protein